MPTDIENLRSTVVRLARELAAALAAIQAHPDFHPQKSPERQGFHPQK